MQDAHVLRHQVLVEGRKSTTSQGRAEDQPQRGQGLAGRAGGDQAGSRGAATAGVRCGPPTIGQTTHRLGRTDHAGIGATSNRGGRAMRPAWDRCVTASVSAPSAIGGLRPTGPLCGRGIERRRLRIRSLVRPAQSPCPHPDPKPRLIEPEAGPQPERRGSSHILDAFQPMGEPAPSADSSQAFAMYGVIRKLVWSAGLLETLAKCRLATALFSRSPAHLRRWG